MSISITVPNNALALTAAGEFFFKLAGVSVDAPVSGPMTHVHATDEEDESPEGGAGAAPATGSAKLDAKGVPFDAAYCANAADPFYGSGQRAGQWKKRKGLADEAYDAWYDERLQDLAPAGTVTVQTGDEGGAPLGDTAAAFAAAGNTTAAAAAGAKVPTNAGELMTWVSEKQAAGLLTQPNIQAAYQFAGLQLADLFVADAGVVAKNVSSLYSILSQSAGA